MGEVIRPASGLWKKEGTAKINGLSFSLHNVERLRADFVTSADREAILEILFSDEEFDCTITIKGAVFKTEVIIGAFDASDGSGSMAFLHTPYSAF